MSFQARLIKKFIPLQLTGWSLAAIKDQREKQEKLARFAKWVPGIKNRSIQIENLPAEWIEADPIGSGVILYLHGGAYALGSINTHRELIVRLTRIVKMPVLAIDYRLAPEHPFPAALQDVESAYRWLHEQGYPSSQIVFAGDSAGGGLLLAALLSLRNAGKPLPAGAVCISPWVDLACSGATMQTKAKEDRILDYENLIKYAKSYAGEQDLAFPLISPLYADLSGLPPLLIQVGTAEILLDDSVRFAENALEAGVEVVLEIWESMFHVFQMVPVLPETKKAMESIGEFVQKRLKAD